MPTSYTRCEAEVQAPFVQHQHVVTEFGELADTPYAVSDAVHSKTPLTPPCRAMQKSLFTFVVTGCCSAAGTLTPSFSNERTNFASALSMTSSFVIGCK
jgi:hypothetical protein